MNRSLQAYVTAVAVLAAAIIIRLAWSDLWQLPPRSTFGVLAFVGLGLLSEFLRLEGGARPNVRISTSMAFVPLFACAALFTPSLAILAAAAIEGGGHFVIHRRKLSSALFNTSQSIVAIALATAAMKAVSGSYWLTPEVELLGFFSFVVVAFGGNLILLTFYFTLANTRSFSDNLRTIAGPGGSNVLYGLLASPVALIAAILYQQLALRGLVLILLPLMVIRYSYQAQRKLEQANHNLLRVLIKAIETRDPYTSGHSIRVSTLARIIAEDIGLPAKKVEAVETAALLHDIGKIDSIYAPIIHKAADLTPEERKTIQTHAMKGSELLEDLGCFSEDITKGVRHHHERYDGTGYPHGLAGEEIPVAGRIIMICDSIDAMLSDRPYRRALTTEQVHGELVRCSGTQFDPAIADVIIRRNTLLRAKDLVVSHSVHTEGAKVFQIA